MTAALFRIEPRGPVGNDHILVLNCACIGRAQKALRADARANSPYRHRISFDRSFAVPADAVDHLEAVSGYAFAMNDG